MEAPGTTSRWQATAPPAAYPPLEASTRADVVGLGGGIVEELAPGQGAALAIGGRRVAVARDGDGALHAVDAVCTHLGCLVKWNDAERSWDCPCHGSRFARSGEVLNPPAEEPPERVRLEEEPARGRGR